MNNYIFILTLMFVFAFEGLTQTVSRNSQGEMIVVFDDGSWRYYESSDSTLLKEDANAQSETENSEAQDGNNQKSRKKDKSVSKSYLLSVVDPNRPLPAYPCVETFSGVDDYSKRKRVDLQKEILFEYSDSEVATYLKGRSYVSCEAGLVGFVGDVRVLSIRITVASRMARADYGYLSNNTLMSIKLINGETVTLFASGSDLGLIDNENNQTVYRASFQISRESQKILTSSPIDKIKIVWSTGYEEYPVTNVDFFMNQIRCLASK
jgi:hypothetical protein